MPSSTHGFATSVVVRAAGRRGAGAPPAEVRLGKSVRAAGRRGAGAPPAEVRLCKSVWRWARIGAGAIRALTIAIAVVASSASVAQSADEPTLEASAAAIESAAQQPDGDRVVVGHLSRKLGLAADVLRQERTRSALGWGDLLIAHYLSSTTGRTFDQTVAEHQTGKSWNEVAESHQVSTDELFQYVKQSEDAVEQRSEDKGVSKSGSTPSHSTGGGGRGGGGGGGHHRN